ncbi:3-phenylpropionate/cinnamic acid dioxygenase subunit beta [Roseococcus sp. SDR]|uniref:3-phenylpropionate/cinnamic acid dioxygenase subunit beta n=1 Tax=Roseococcus sp. SDR TaxID=2835532 RepID=UPI001BCB98D2|nr:3-phenylpropionate/cinnamic acid dioxygenase subunit beta [Roseococcus sp. SDR]MBS7789880.1 3-phenylpropionate/cinnamic acid dioxygenase subunit beta [Roseococcus sp. SDR]MBV1845194.1 3-phenylpropionate/cinnamic acid dioxygenase subunit beta [Roseococcus sp. SDR]
MPPSEAALAALLLRAEIEEWLLAEADLLDARRYRDWLALLHPEVRVAMPIARNLAPALLAREERTRAGQDVMWVDEGFRTLEQRVRQLETGIHWAEEPASRVTRLISGVRILEAAPDRVLAGCRFILHRNRLEDETDLLIGRRRDTLLRAGEGWLLHRREVLLDQSVLHAKNLTTFL